jgi:hypothetical protein
MAIGIRNRRQEVDLRQVGRVDFVNERRHRAQPLSFGQAFVKSAAYAAAKGKQRDLGATRTNAKGRYSLRVSPPNSGTLRIMATSEGQRDTIRRTITVRR